eukprot:1195334-Prorocentrum_minimum.AAC.3
MAQHVGIISPGSHKRDVSEFVSLLHFSILKRILCQGVFNLVSHPPLMRKRGSHNRTPSARVLFFNTILPVWHWTPNSKPRLHEVLHLRLTAGATRQAFNKRVFQEHRTAAPTSGPRAVP